ncbi:MAG: hypothetical protein HFF84_03895 [Oscillibacter sp.]|nr:hypothetical protein [Oscillibacter sp.]
MKYATLIDFGSTYTKVACVYLPERRVLMTGCFPSTVHTDARIGLHQCFDAVKGAVGRAALEESLKLSSSSAAGGLRMAVIGLTKSLSILAGRNTAFGAGAKIMASESGWLTPEDVRALEGADIEIVLLCGGYEKGNRTMVLHNAEVLSGSGLKAPVIYAGNSGAAQMVREILCLGGKECFLVDNVIPAVGELNTGPAEEVIRNLFMKRITNMAGMDKVQEEIGEILMPTPAAVLAAGKLLSEGIEGGKGLGGVMMLDVGGATTDVYSFIKNKGYHYARIVGAAEPDAKRTVEGDMGMRESSICVLEEAGAESMAKSVGVTEEALRKSIEKRLLDTSFLADTPEELRIDQEIASRAISISARRHAGRIEKVHSKGVREIQRGKNLTKVETLIGTGGILVNGTDPDRLLQCAALQDGEDETILLPRTIRTLVDRDYVFYAAGLLQGYDEAAAFAIMKASLFPGGN